MKRILLFPATEAGAPPAAPQTSMDRAMGALDTMTGTAPAAPEPAPAKPAPAKEPVKDLGPRGGTPTKPVETQKAAPAKEAAKVEPAKAAEAAKEPELESTKMAPKALRDAYERLKADHKKMVEERKAAPAAAPQQPADDTERKRISEELEGERKRRAALEDHMRFIDYEASPEYQERYHKPYVAICQDAVAEISQLKITAEDGSSRQATTQDFWKIASMPDTEEALAAAVALFGSDSKANLVMAQRRAVRNAYQAAQVAKDEFKKTATERGRQAAEQQATQQRAREEKWKAYNAEAAEQEWMQPVEGDDEGNALLESGIEQADAVFGGLVTDEKTGQKRPATEEEILKLHADLRNHAAAFPRLLKQNETLRGRVSELEKEVEEFQKSGPGTGQPGDGGKPAAPAGDAIDQAFDRFASKRK